MKILAISDEVVSRVYDEGIAKRFGDVDLVLSCGDLPRYYLEFIVTMLNVPLYYVSGNHDKKPPPRSLDHYGIHEHLTHVHRPPGGCINLDGRVVDRDGLLIAGLEGSMRYKNGPYQYTQAEMSWKAGRLGARMLANRLLKGRALDILITHSPPFGIHDAKDRCHTGFRALVSFMETWRPRYLIHGHSHVHDRRNPTATQYCDTMVLNAHPYRVLEIAGPGEPTRD